MNTEQEQMNKKYQDVPKDKVLIYDVETTGLSCIEQNGRTENQ